MPYEHNKMVVAIRIKKKNKKIPVTGVCILDFITACPLDVKTQSTWVNTALSSGNRSLFTMKFVSTFVEIKSVVTVVVVVVAKLSCRETVHMVFNLRWLDVQRVETELDWSAQSDVSLASYRDFNTSFLFKIYSSKRSAPLRCMVCSFRS